MTGHFIFAFTETHGQPYPGYVNLTVNEGDSQATVTLREYGHNGSKSASLKMPDETLKRLAEEIGRYLNEKEAARIADDETDSA